MSATNRGALRRDHDHYPTPAESIDPLLPYVRIEPSTVFLEPCRGMLGGIYGRVDCAVKLWAELALGVDYLTTPFSGVDLVITNPPFPLALLFLQKSLDEAKTVIYLLRLNFLGSQARQRFWRANRPTHLLALPERPVFVWVCHGYKQKGHKQKGCGASFLPGEVTTCPHCGGRVGAGTDACDYGWFCWDRGNLVTLAPGVHVL